MNTVLGQRVLPGLEGLLGNTILVVSNSMFDTESHINLALVAPGLAEIDELRAGLCAWLKTTLTAIDPDWVYDVTIQEGGDPEITIVINDAAILGDASLDLVLATAKAFIAPFAARRLRDVYVLKGEQRLVPLTFDRPVTTTAMSVTLPESLVTLKPKRFIAKQLTRDALHGADCSMGSSAAACAYLAGTLELAFDGPDGADWIDNVVVSESAKGVHIAVNFSYRAPIPTPFVINAVQTIIMEVLKQHVMYGGLNNDLVFVSTTPAGEGSYDDGGDYGDRYYEH